jgi:hypothetical protein
MTKLPRTPLRAALIAFGLTLLIGLVGGLVVLIATGNLDDNPHERGRMLGQGLAPLSIIVGAIAYVVQKKKYDQR